MQAELRTSAAAATRPEMKERGTPARGTWRKERGHPPRGAPPSSLPKEARAQEDDEGPSAPGAAAAAQRQPART
eukprot:10447498-Alexandrium_andersonii.AAC.1